ncbi:uncharacterized protein LOC119981871 [Tripterygium wilfordii]|uniref:uncharacterized protein LOC119981871 n=1 Tax=Tripterygium wilfordii TaxID=458696 RepID=UPI0018F82EE2|nr:uncharacterized protein LOC119981871 [Tripterygium wilfordii]
MVLETLSSSFSQFKLNFNMNKMEMSLPMLMKELQSAEQIMGKEKQVHFVKVSNSGPKKYGCIYLMRRKSEALDKFKEFKAFAENQLDKCIKAIQSDRGGEYMLDEYKQYLTDNSIVSKLSAPRTPQQNGVAERRNRTLLDMIRQLNLDQDLCCAIGLDFLKGLVVAISTILRVKKNVENEQIAETNLDATPELRRSGRVARPPERFMYFGESVLVVSDELEPDPTSYEEAISDVDADHWLKAIESELESMYSNEVWDLVDIPDGIKPIGSKWVDKRKRGVDGKVETFKARLRKRV